LKPWGFSGESWGVHILLMGSDSEWMGLHLFWRNVESWWQPAGETYFSVTWQNRRAVPQEQQKRTEAHAQHVKDANGSSSRC
jgi:hypothetical protein